MRALIKRFAPASVVAALALAVIVPLVVLGNPDGDDIRFHLTSWMDVHQQWRDGVLFPRWAASAWFGFGEPRFTFYPPVSWLLGAALGSVLPWRAVPGAFVFIAQAITGATMFHLARERLSEAHGSREPTTNVCLRREATWAAAFFMIDPYRLFTAHVRCAFGELLATAFFPLALSCAIRIGVACARATATTHWALVRHGVPMALVFGAIWATNVPTAILTSYTLLLVFAAYALMSRSPLPLVAGAAALLLGFVLVGFYTVPAVYERQFVQLEWLHQPYQIPENQFLLAPLLRLSPEHAPLIASIVVLYVLLCGFAVLVQRNSHTLVGQRDPQSTFIPAAVGAACVVLLTAISAPLWRYAPGWRLVQFPWRWLAPLGAGVALFAATIGRAHAWRLWAVLALFMVIGVCISGLPARGSSAVSELTTQFREGHGYRGAEEYRSRSTDSGLELPSDAPLVSADAAPGAAPPIVHVEHWGPESKTILVDAPSRVSLALRLSDYPAWRAEIDGRPERIESRAHTGQVTIAVPAGRSRVRIVLASTGDWKVGWLLSVGAAMTLLAMVWALLARRPREAFEGGSHG